MSCAEITHAFRHVVRLPGYSVEVFWGRHSQAYVVELFYGRHDLREYCCRRMMQDIDVSMATASRVLSGRHFLRDFVFSMYREICDYQLREMERLYDR